MRSWLVRRIAGRWPHRLQGCKKIKPLGADILELEADHIDRGGECPQAGGLMVVADRRRSRHLAGGAVLLPGQDVAPIAEPGGGERRHPAKLAAADQADRRFGGSGERSCRSAVGHGLGLLLRAALSSRSASAASLLRQDRRGRAGAAFTAPARPIASVPTGMPAGICTIDSRLSIPLSAWDSTGTPSTGSGVQAAHMPGR